MTYRKFMDIIQNSNKVKKAGTLIRSLFNGDFWIGDAQLNVAEIKIINIKQQSKREIEDESEDLKEFDLLASNTAPSGYVRFVLKNTDTAELFLEHNMTLKYVSLKGDVYIKGFVLGNAEREIDCYSSGENEYIIIKKLKKDDYNNRLSIVIKEKNGEKHTYNVTNGILEDWIPIK